MTASLGLERRNPLPKGRYWVFRLGVNDINRFDAWLRAWTLPKFLRVVSTELDVDADPITEFVVFEVLVDGAVVWEGPGLPDRSPPNVTSAQDVIQAPNIDAGLDQLRKTLTAGGEAIPTLLFLAGAIYLLTKGGKS